jgi:hypothetical protein
MEEHFVFTRK